ncbi:MAG: hypothetical protein ABI824_07430 [Acidobacteriota bacterium]
MKLARTLLIRIVAVALISTPAWGENLSVSGPRPLLEAARTISVRSGVSLSYEDPLTQADPLNPSAKPAPLQARTVRIEIPAWPEPFNPRVPTILMESANILEAIKVVGDVLKQEPANSALTLRRASDGRLFLGPTQSLLDIQIHFPGAGRRKDPWPVFQKALEQASGFQVSASAGEGWESDGVEASDGSAREVLLKILEASRHWGPLYSPDPEVWLPKFQWDLTAEPDAKAQGGARYKLSIRALQIEYRDAQGKLHLSSTVTDRIVEGFDPDDEP